MKYLAAYLLLNAGGKASPSASDIESVLSSVGIESDKERISSLLTALADKDVNELIAEGQGKLASVPSGGAVAGASGASGAASADAPAEEAAAEEKEESDDDMGFGLFD
ncbi:ribosomal protein 60S [Backusella circina FSU 941]|nr:ribosomal protein 60S [Backusella circina FSU 941]